MNIAIERHVDNEESTMKHLRMAFSLKAQCQLPRCCPAATSVNDACESL